MGSKLYVKHWLRANIRVSLSFKSVKMPLVDSVVMPIYLNHFFVFFLTNV